tara:strand:+ start:13 stop:126 length:114 start_codon:yes stop_codon:yes gene_type:complete
MTKVRGSKQVNVGLSNLAFIIMATIIVGVIVLTIAVG